RRPATSNGTVKEKRTARDGSVIARGKSLRSVNHPTCQVDGRRAFDSSRALCYATLTRMAAPIPHEALARGVRAAFGAAARIALATPLAGDASNRRYIRLELSGVTALSPPAVVAMLLDGPRPVSDGLGGAGANAELPFLNVGRYLAAHGLPIPTVHLARPEEGFLLLEDIGDTTLWRAVEAAPARAPGLFAAAVDLLVQLQVIGSRHVDGTCVAFGHRFDGRLARLGVEHFVEHRIDTPHGRELADRDRARPL